MSTTVALFASLGPTLLHYAVHADACALRRLPGTMTLPGNVQYACAHVSGQFLYVISSDGGPGVAGRLHHVSAFQIDCETGALRTRGAPVPLQHRPIHINTDITSEHLLIAYNVPSALTVHRIADDGSVGAEIAQPGMLDTGTFPHQVYVTRSNRTAILVARGNDASAARAEEPGALKVFTYRGGRLENRGTVAPGGGYGFGPRNIDIHPSQHYLYVSLERQNALQVFRFDADRIEAEPAFRIDTLDVTEPVHPRQMAGAVRVHPEGRCLYVANRAFGTTREGDRDVFAGGENTIVVYAIDERTGRPEKIQSIDTGGIYPRTFSIDPSGRMLVVGNLRPLLVRTGKVVRLSPASLSVFSIGRDGRLAPVDRLAFTDSRDDLFWCGLACAPAGVQERS